MNVVIVNESIPYPANSGNRIRTLNLMLRLARRHRITYLCRADADPTATRAAAHFLRDNGIESHFVNDPPRRKSGPNFYASLAINLLSSLPYAVASHNSAPLRAAIAEYATKNSVDLWQFEWLAYADALAHLPQATTLLMAHNIEALIWQRYHGTESSPLKRRYLRGQWQKFQRLEERLFAQVNSVIVVSEEDAQLARERYGTDNAVVVENGIDSDFFAAATGARDPNQIVFLGSLDWRPNQDAVKIMLEDIFPRVIAVQPRARLKIVGRKPPRWLRDQINRCANADLHADIADVRPFLAGAGVMAVPLRIGGGSRLKILEALACGLPVVTTSVGCEGLGLRDGREITVADGHAKMVQALIACLRSPKAAAAQAARGKAVVLDRYDWDGLAEKLEALWFSAARARQQSDRFMPQAAV